MYTMKTRVTNLTKHPRQVPWLGIPADWFRPGETRDINGVYPQACMSRKSQFDYEISHGLVKVVLLTDMPTAPLDTELPKDVVIAPPAPAPAKKAEAVKPAAPVSPADVETKQEPLTKDVVPVETPVEDPLKRVHPQSGIRMEKMPEMTDMLKRKLEHPDMPPATPLFPSEIPLQTEPDNTAVLGDAPQASDADTLPRRGRRKKS